MSTKINIIPPIATCANVQREFSATNFMKINLETLWFCLKSVIAIYHLLSCVFKFFYRVIDGFAMYTQFETPASATDLNLIRY
jgi:hypothetical protein